MDKGILLANTGAIYLGTEQFLTLVAVLGICGAVLIFLLKHYFGEITGGISKNAKSMTAMREDLQAELKRNNDRINEQISHLEEKTNDRLNHLEEKTNDDIGSIKQELNDIKGEFATTFVQRDDFFRYMNGMEANIKDTNAKVDKILMLMTDRRE